MKIPKLPVQYDDYEESIYPSPDAPMDEGGEPRYDVPEPIIWGIDSEVAPYVVIAINNHYQMLDQLERTQRNLCRAACPQVWDANTPQPHCPACIEAQAFLANLDEVEY